MSERTYLSNETQLDQLFDVNRSTVIWTYSLKENKLVYISPSVENVFGYTCEKLYNNDRLWLDVIEPHDLRFDIKDSQVIKQEYRIIRPDGEIKWVSDESRIVTDKQSQQIFIEGIVTDITPYKKTEGLKLSKNEGNVMEFHSIENDTIHQELLLKTLKDSKYFEEDWSKRTAEELHAKNLKKNRTFKRQEIELQNIEKLIDQTVNALANIIKRKDPYTAGHHRNVADLACKIAENMNLSPKRIKGIYVASILHDIGKITVPNEILSKPITLSTAEGMIVRTHCQVGYEILKEINFPWKIADIVYQHHERINGSGYPRGLCDEEIMLEAKILAVADVVDAISSNRPYRPALGLDYALTEITKNRGILYAPEVVDACLEIYR